MNSTTAPPIAGAEREVLRQRLRSEGFDEVRFAAAGSVTDGGFRAWIDAGHHADMQWMERTATKREDPGLVLQGAQSIILLGINYWRGQTAAAAADDPRRPVWARYTLNEDYHDTIKPGLVAAGRVLEELFGAAQDDYRWYVDTGPVLERGWAARSGLGFRGKNAMLVSRRHGNWLLLACLVTRLGIAADEPLRSHLPRESGETAGLLCGKCTRCLDACPTDAFPAPGVVDSRRCISYQTIENKGIIPRELREGIGARVYGCDACLDVCPWNRFAKEGRGLLLAARDDIAELTLRELLELTPVTFSRHFRRTPIKRLKLTGLLRNASIAAGNSGDVSLLPALVRLARHESALVRAHAVWAVRRLAGAGAFDLLHAARANENDPAVLAEYS